jgi:RimJ/RimL family protein N-acetyltransferase
VWGTMMPALMITRTGGTPRVALREIARGDVALVNAWRQDRLLTDPLGAPPRHISLDVDLAWFDTYLAHRDSNVRCMICVDDEPTPVGIVSLTGIHVIYRSGEFHMMIGRRDLHGRGIGTAATAAMVRHGFGDLNLHRIHLSVLASNAPAIKVYERVGFRHEGRAREAVYKNGRYEDVLLMAVLAHEFSTP